MKLITLEDYLKSVNQEGSGISEEHELLMISECIVFIQNIANHFKVRMEVCGTALTIFHYYKKRHPFTEFDRYMLATLCLFLACKIDYHRVTYIQFIEYYYHNRKQGRARVKPFEDIKENLKEDFVDLEFKILITIEFEFEFDSPYKYLAIFQEQYHKHLMDKYFWSKDDGQKKLFEKHFQFFVGMARRFIYDSYIHPFCLYFPAPAITAACIYISAEIFLNTKHTNEITEQGQQLGSQIMPTYGLKSFLEVEITPDSDYMVRQENVWLKYVLTERRQADESVSMIDVMYLQKEILEKIAQQMNKT